MLEECGDVFLYKVYLILIIINEINPRLEQLFAAVTAMNNDALYRSDILLQADIKENAAA